MHDNRPRHGGSLTFHCPRCWYMLTASHCKAPHAWVSCIRAFQACAVTLKAEVLRSYASPGARKVRPYWVPLPRQGLTQARRTWLGGAEWLTIPSHATTRPPSWRLRVTLPRVRTMLALLPSRFPEVTGQRRLTNARLMAGLGPVSHHTCYRGGCRFGGSESYKAATHQGSS